MRFVHMRAVPNLLLHVLPIDVHYSESYLFTKAVKGHPVQLSEGLRATWIVCYCLAVGVSVLGVALKVSSPRSSFLMPSLYRLS